MARLLDCTITRLSEHRHIIYQKDRKTALYSMVLVYIYEGLYSPYFSLLCASWFFFFSVPYIFHSLLAKKKKYPKHDTDVSSSRTSKLPPEGPTNASPDSTRYCPSNFLIAYDRRAAEQKLDGGRFQGCFFGKVIK